MVLKDFIRKGGIKKTKQKEVRKPPPTPAGPSKHTIGSLKAVILAITGGATGVEHGRQGHATGAEKSTFTKLSIFVLEHQSIYLVLRTNMYVI